MNMANPLNLWEKQWTLHRPFLVSFAFRMTGSLAEAEDLVQDTFLESTAVDASQIENHKSWLTKVCSNKCLDHLKSAYKRRETYSGPWLPDAIPESYQLWGSLQEGSAPDQNILVSETLTTSFLLLAESLTPEERVVFLLSEVFEYSFKDIAQFLDKSDDSCRKIAQRAREAVASKRAKFNNTANAEKLIARFFEHAKNGNDSAIKELLADESEFWSDGGGKVAASTHVLTHNSQIASFFKFLGTTPTFKTADYKLEFHFVNSRPGVVISKKLPSGLWEFETIMTFEMRDEKIARIYAQRNPDKFKALLKTSLVP
jgi:RNA polymerase sigma-70 factor (ECF subfamily)